MKIVKQQCMLNEKNNNYIAFDTKIINSLKISH